MVLGKASRFYKDLRARKTINETLCESVEVRGESCKVVESRAKSWEIAFL